LKYITTLKKSCSQLPVHGDFTNEHIQYTVADLIYTQLFTFMQDITDYDYVNTQYDMYFDICALTMQTQ